jgi:hypothetical protein
MLVQDLLVFCFFSRRSQLLNVNQIEGKGCSKSISHLGTHLEDLAEKTQNLAQRNPGGLKLFAKSASQNGGTNEVQY